MLGLLSLLLIRQLCSLLGTRERLGSHGRGGRDARMPHRGKETKSQVSPSGGEHRPHSPFRSHYRLIFFLFKFSSNRPFSFCFLISPVNYHKFHKDTSSSAVRRCQVAWFQNIHDNKLTPSKTGSQTVGGFVCQVNKDVCKQDIWSRSKISFHQCLILHRRIVITDSPPSGILRSSLPILHRCQIRLQSPPRWIALTSCLPSPRMCRYTPRSDGQNQKHNARR